jgi:hypothetical protein
MDPRVTELHNIMPIANFGSVMQHGILSYERAAKLSHLSVALQPVQDKRDKKQVPGGLKLHQYANLYFHARNPMLYKRLANARSLCVLRVSTEVLKISGAVITDQNAASDWVRFYSPVQWRYLPFDDIFAAHWTDPELPSYYRRKSRKCAEILVPHCVNPAYLMGAHVIDQVTAVHLADAGCTLPIAVSPGLFFH